MVWSCFLTVISASMLVLLKQMHRNDDALAQLLECSDTITSLTKLLYNGRHWVVQERSAALIYMISMRYDAKVELVNEGTVLHLLELLKHSRISLDKAVMSALGSIAVANEGEVVTHVSAIYCYQT